MSHLCGVCGNEALGKTVTWAGDGHGQVGGNYVPKGLRFLVIYEKEIKRGPEKLKCLRVARVIGEKFCDAEFQSSISLEEIQKTVQPRERQISNQNSLVWVKDESEKNSA